jgi:hypothetical protein
LEHAQRKVLLIQRYITKKSKEQQALKQSFKNSEVQSEIARNRACLRYQFWLLAQAKATVQDIRKDTVTIHFDSITEVMA